jgi:hypothetical protein
MVPPPLVDIPLSGVITEFVAILELPWTLVLLFPGTTLFGALGFKFWLLLGVEAEGGSAWAGADWDGDAGVIWAGVTWGAELPEAPSPPLVGVPKAMIAVPAMRNAMTFGFTFCIKPVLLILKRFLLVMK